MSVPTVRIYYHRLPDREEVFEQHLVLDRDDVKVTLATGLDFDTPVRARNHIILESGSDAVWFTFPGRWHDVGRFHRADGRFTGLYANVLTPPRLGDDHVWETTDLFLDLWIEPGGEPVVLDEAQFREARRRGWIEEETAERAVAEVEALKEAWREGRWPPPVVERWTLERARRALEEARAP